MILLNRQRILSAILIWSLVLFCGFAEASLVTNLFPLLTYAEQTVPTYDKPGGGQKGFISPEIALVYIKQINPDGWAYGSYPIAGGKRIYRWFQMRELQGYLNFKNYELTVTSDQIVFRTSAGNSRLGSLKKNDKVTVIAERGDSKKIIYKVGGGNEYKMGWINNNNNSPDIPVKYHDPEGNTDVIEYQNEKLHVKGWAFDRDDMNATTAVEVWVGGQRNSSPNLQHFKICANKIYNDINIGNHGFEASLPFKLEKGKQVKVFIYAINDVGEGKTKEIGSKEFIIKDLFHDPEGKTEIINYVDNKLYVKGWAFDRDDMNAITTVEVWVGGQRNSNPNLQHYQVLANKNYNDIRIGKHGFEDSHIISVDKGKNIQVYVYAINNVGGGETKEIGSEEIIVPDPNPLPPSPIGNHDPQGKVDSIQYKGVNQIYVKGWAYDEDDLNTAINVEFCVGSEKSDTKFTVQANKLYSTQIGKHGFDGTYNLDLSQYTGWQTVYAIAKNIGNSGKDQQIGSVRINVPLQIDGSATTEYINSERIIKVSGWCNTGRVDYIIAGITYTMNFNNPNRICQTFEIIRALPETITGVQTVKVYAVDISNPNNRKLIGQNNIDIPRPNENINHNPQGKVDEVGLRGMDQLYVKGWAYDEDDINLPVTVEFRVGSPTGNPLFTTTANRFYSNEIKNHSFEGTYRVNLLDKFYGLQSVYVTAKNIGNLGKDKQIGNISLNIIIPPPDGHSTISDADAYGRVLISGWTNTGRVEYAIAGETRTININNPSYTTKNFESLYVLPDEIKEPVTVMVYAVDATNHYSKKLIGTKAVKKSVPKPDGFAQISYDSKSRKVTISGWINTERVEYVIAGVTQVVNITNPGHEKANFNIVYEVPNKNNGKQNINVFAVDVTNSYPKINIGNSSFTSIPKIEGNASITYSNNDRIIKVSGWTNVNHVEYSVAGTTRFINIINPNYSKQNFEDNYVIPKTIKGKQDVVVYAIDTANTGDKIEIGRNTFDTLPMLYGSVEHLSVIDSKTVHIVIRTNAPKIIIGIHNKTHIAFDMNNPNYEEKVLDKIVTVVEEIIGTQKVIVNGNDPFEGRVLLIGGVMTITN